MENGETKYKILSFALFIAITATIVFVIVPQYRPKTPEGSLENIDFSNSAWIERYMERGVGLFGKDFYVGTAFSYNIRSNKMVVTFARRTRLKRPASIISPFRRTLWPQ